MNKLKIKNTIQEDNSYSMTYALFENKMHEDQHILNRKLFSRSANKNSYKHKLVFILKTHMNKPKQFQMLQIIDQYLFYAMNSNIKINLVIYY